MSSGSVLPPLVDSHCHLIWPQLKGDLDGVLARMAEAGVAQAVVVATTPADALEVKALCEGRPGLFPTCGLHPNDVPADPDAAVGEIGRLLAEAQGTWVGVGETGIDYYRDRVERGPQQAAFAAQLALARRFDLPAIVHIRDKDGRMDAYDDVARLIEREPGVRGVIHCYTGDGEHARRYMAAGFAISFSGILTFPKGENVRQAAREVPPERTLVETDAPFLAPMPHRGGTCEPAHVALTCRAWAGLKGLPEAEARATTAANARALFRLPQPPDA
jgi:TatD DNase family protein